MNDRLLSLKYKGVRTPWEIMVNPSQYGWSCRKWIRHQTNSTEKEYLKQFADALINEGKIILDCLPAINRIAEHVQRWRKDKEGYTLEPDQREEFKELRRLIEIARSTPDSMRGILMQELLVTDTDKLNNEELPQALKAATLLRFISKLSSTPFKSVSSVEIIKKVEQAIQSLSALYGYVAFGRNTADLVDELLFDVDIEPDIQAPLSKKPTSFSCSQIVFIETYQGPDDVLCHCEYRQGKVYVSANSKHKWFEKSALPPDTTNELLYAIGETYLSQLGERETIEAFLAELGVNLARRTK
jgi:hypothetical protein